MPVTVPEPTSAAAIAALTSALSGASADDATAGNAILSSLESAATAYNAAATSYNAEEAAFPGEQSAALTAAEDAADRAKTIATFDEPAEPVSYHVAGSIAPADVGLQLARLDRASQSVSSTPAGGDIAASLQRASVTLSALAFAPTEPSSTALLVLVAKAEAYTEYLTA